MAQLDNDTDSLKHERRVQRQEPKLLRYVPTSDVEERFVNDKFETYDLKPTEDRPRRYAFLKKPKNPADGSVNYAYSRSSSSCSSPNSNLPTIAEHAEHYATYRVGSLNNVTPGFGDDFDKYFTKPRDLKKIDTKVGYQGSHPDSLYRVPTELGSGSSRLVRICRSIQWPLALVILCVSLATFVYFLMPGHAISELDKVNATYFEQKVAQASFGGLKTSNTTPNGSKTSEIDFYEAESDATSISDTATEKINTRILPVFPKHITPEVQYGNEKADTRSPKLIDVLETTTSSPAKPHITQKPEKPLAIYFNSETTTSKSTQNSGIVQNLKNAINARIVEKLEPSLLDPYAAIYKRYNYGGRVQGHNQLPSIYNEYYGQPQGISDVSFTSGHSKLFGISIEDAEKMKTTTQNSVYNTRVSPTLPTWRGHDDSTTKNYPANIYADVQCRSTRLAMCRGVLPYDLAGAPAQVLGVDVTSLLPEIEYLVSTNCSDRIRHFACALLEPECNPPPYHSKRPCHNLCKAIVDSCESYIPQELVAVFNCKNYSDNDCIQARAPCFPREFGCKDGTCVPRDYLCDGNNDCPHGEDEIQCAECEANEFKCPTGGCILNRWLCDGYADCQNGEDESEQMCRTRRGRSDYVEEGHPETRDNGEESAGSAPALTVRRPTEDLLSHNENESKELLMTSDSHHNVFKRNYTRRPSLSRLSAYQHPAARTQFAEAGTKQEKADIKPAIIKPAEENQFNPIANKYRSKKEQVSQAILNDNISKPYAKKSKLELNSDANDDVNLEDLTDAVHDEEPSLPVPGTQRKIAAEKQKLKSYAPNPVAFVNKEKEAKINPSANNYEQVLDGVDLLKKAQEEEVKEEPVPVDIESSVESNKTEILYDMPSFSGPKTSHVSPCPTGELRCVDGRCITLAQLCDGTIDCTDHADEDNCYT